MVVVRGRVELPTFRFSDSVGNYAADPDLWGFCGARTRSSTRLPGHQEHPGNANGAARRAEPDRGASFNAARQVLQGHNAVPGALARARRVIAAFPAGI